MRTYQFILKVLLLLWCSTGALVTTLAQKLSEAEVVSAALQNNQQIKSAESEVAYYQQLKKTGTDLGRLNAVWMRGQYNTIEQDNNITLTQSLPFPGTLAAQVKLGEQHVVGATSNLTAVKNKLVFDVRTTYERLVYLQATQLLLLSQDSLYTDFAKAAALRYKTGESNLLEMTTAETQLQEIKNTIRLNEADVFAARKQLQVLVKSDAPIDASTQLSKRTLAILADTVTLESSPRIQVAMQQVKINQQLGRVERSKLLPDFSIGYFSQTLIGYQNTTGTEVFFDKSNRFSGFTVGVQIPVWFAPQASRAKAASYLEEASRQSADYVRQQVTSEFELALRELDKNQASLTYYESSALKNSTLILSQARQAYQAGEIGYVEYLQSLRNALAIRTNYLQALHQFNLSVIHVEFIIGNY